MKKQLRPIVTTLGCISLSVLAAGCGATVRSNANLEQTLASIRAAEEVGAPKVPAAKLHLQLAQEQTTHAKELLAKNETEQAGYVLMRAQADADLALAMARESIARGEAQSANDKVTAPTPN